MQMTIKLHLTQLVLAILGVVVETELAVVVIVEVKEGAEVVAVLIKKILTEILEEEEKVAKEEEKPRKEVKLAISV